MCGGESEGCVTADDLPQSSGFAILCPDLTSGPDVDGPTYRSPFGECIFKLEHDHLPLTR
jgi:hypothetical protein